MSNTTEYHEANKASAVLAKIANGEADTEFARLIPQAISRCQLTGKAATVTVTVTIEPGETALILRAAATAKLPKLKASGSQMHVGPSGELLDQMEFIMGGGPTEKPAPIPATSSTGSGRLRIVSAAAKPAPIAPVPSLAPLAAVGDGGPIITGKDAAAKDL